MVDTVVIPSTAPEEDPKHIEAMVAKADAASQPPTEEAPETPEANTEDRPQWLPEKFKSPEDLAKAYAELESKMGKKEAPAQAEAPTEEKAQNATENEVADELQSKGLDLYEFSAEFAQNGSLSPESYEKLEKAGYPRNIVDQFVEGQKARAALYESEVKAVAGGDKQFAEMVEWAKVNMTPQEIAAYNSAIESGDQAKAKLAVAGVYQKFSQARPQEPSLFKGITSGNSGDAYESVAQLQKDMASPDYKTDPAFRAKVQAKLSRSNIL